MSTQDYPEPYRLPAGLLAVAVHVVFFTLLYFGFNWHTQPPEGMVVDLWTSLPDAKPVKVKAAPPEPKKVEPPKPVEPPKTLEPPKPVEQPKAEIEVKAKKTPEEKPKPPAPKPEPKPEPKPVPKVDAQAEQQAAAQRAAAAAQAAARNRLIGEYVDRIRAKIRHNIMMPPGVADDAVAIFDVTLLPGGSVLFVKLKKPSGNVAYDAAVERAIKLSDPLPLPPDVTLFQAYFRNLELKFRPKD
jgi:colicin import membrane protein